MVYIHLRGSIFGDRFSKLMSHITPKALLYSERKPIDALLLNYFVAIHAKDLIHAFKDKSSHE